MKKKIKYPEGGNPPSDSTNQIDWLNSGEYASIDLKAAKITPLSKYQREFIEANPIEDWSSPLSALEKGLGYSKSNLPKKTTAAYNKAQNNYVAKRLLEDNPKEDWMSRPDWLNRLTPMGIKAIENSNSKAKIKPNLWAQAENALMGSMPHGNANFKNPSTTEEEFKNTSTGDLLAPLQVLPNTVNAVIKGKQGVGETLKGEPSNIGITKSILFDPLTYVGVGIGKKALTTGTKSSMDNVVAELRRELSENGIVQSQKTPNLPWKQPIRKGVNPWGYDAKDKIEDVKSLFINSANKEYKVPEKIEKSYQTYLLSRKPGSEVLSKQEFIQGLDINHLYKTKREVVNARFASRFSDENDMAVKNRYATWDMYLGKPQTSHPMYDISSLTKSKDDVVYTIKEEFMNKKALEGRFNDYIDTIKLAENKGVNKTLMVGDGDMIKKGNSWIIPDRDSGLFGTMGGFNWNIEKMADGNYKALANDVWDLQPLKNRNIGDTDKLSGRMLNKTIKPIQNIEVGKALGIGKPLNVKVGFIINGETKKIINTFGLAPATGLGIGAYYRSQLTEPKQTYKSGGWLDNE